MTRSRRSRCLFWISLALLAFPTLSFPASHEKRPKLVVFIAIDAFRYDYLTRFYDHFSDGGFKLLLRGGANFTNTHVAHFRPSTAPGHATMLTGASGHLSGIVDNEWYDRDLREKVNCVEDRQATLVGTRQTDPSEGRSPKNLQVTTVGDELKLATQFRSKVIGISYKDRGAILLAGKMADAAYWFDEATGRFISSTSYMKSLPEWVTKFNERKLPDRFFGKEWKKLLAEDVYQLSREDDFPHELDYKGSGIVFPHPMTGNAQAPGKDFYQLFKHTPFADVHLAEFARAVVENAQLGVDEVTDLLTISFSATDRVGHQYGPYSQEQQDNILRLDRVLEDFLEFLHQKVGLENVYILLTADHGSAPIAEFIARSNVQAGRIDTSRIPEEMDSVLIPKTVEDALDRAFGQGEWVEAFVKPNLYFNLDALRREKLSIAQVEEVTKESLLQVPGIADVFGRSQLLSGALPDNEVTRMVLRQLFRQRSGDLVVHNKPYFLTAAYKRSQDKGADHETCYDYDTHIPLILFGPVFRAGVYRFHVEQNDIAPTLANALGLASPSGNEGRVLFQCLSGTE